MNKNVAGEWDFKMLKDDFDFNDLEDWGFEEKDIEGFKDEVKNPFEEWDGMPDMGDNTSDTEKAFGKIIVWFENEDFYNDFQNKIDQNFKLGDNTTNSIWHPKK